MAFTSTRCWKWMVGGLRGARAATYATSSTGPKQKAYTPSVEFGVVERAEEAKKSKTWKVGGDFVPVYMALGAITLSFSLGLQTGLHQLLFAPNVRVKKKKREKVVEVEEPEQVIDEAERFLHKSFFRKVAHVQEFENHV